MKKALRIKATSSPRGLPVNLSHPEHVLELEKEEVEEALKCLYLRQPPELQKLKELSLKDWELLVFLLDQLLREREKDRLH